MLCFDILYLCVALLPKNCDDRGTSRCGVDNPIENNGQLETCEPASLRDLIVLRFNDYSYIRDKKTEDGNASNDDADRTGTQAPMAQPQNEKQGFIVETYCAL